jgi:hypothetical protein
VLLDVGCGSRPRGDFNVDLCSGGWNRQEGNQVNGEFLDPSLIKNFRVADAQSLPFENDSFESCYSSHTIEHVADPFRMLSEMVRVSKRLVVVRCPHAKGSGAKRPFHLHTFDEGWFTQASARLGLHCDVFINSYDYPVSNRLPFRSKIKDTFGYRALRHVERKIVNRGLYRRPFELEARLSPIPSYSVNEPVQYVVAVNDQHVFESCFKKNAGPVNIIRYDDVDSLPKCYNAHVDGVKNFAGWTVFCHQDLIFRQPLNLELLRRDAVYGVIGARLTPHLIGCVMQTDGSLIGVPAIRPEPVHVLDEMCLIVHSDLFKQGLRFDEAFSFHFYGADLCLTALRRGFNVYVLPSHVQHKSKTLTGQTNSLAYNISREMFRIKWSHSFPVRTTTTSFE